MIKRDDIRIDQEFELDGYWWAPEQTERRPGTLAWSPQTGARLKVLDLFPQGTATEVGPDSENAYSENGTSAAWSPGPPEDLTVLYGETLAGVPCSLLEPICVNWRSENFRHSREIWTCNRVLHGVYVAGADEFTFDSARIELRGLREWATRPTTQFGKGLNGHEEPEQVEAILAGARLAVQVTPTLTTNAQEQRRSIIASARFELDEQVSLLEFRSQFLSPLQDLLLLGTREPVPVVRLVAYLGEPPAAELGPPFPAGRRSPVRRPSVEILERVHVDWPRSRQRQYERMLLTLGSFGAKASELLARWFEVRAAIGPAASFFFGTLGAPSSDLNDRLFKLMNFAEAYHRETLDDPPFDDDLHAVLLERMLTSLDDEEQRRRYKMRLQYANSQTQRERVEVLVLRATAVVPELAPLEADLSRALVDTRNYVTHWGNSTTHVLEDAGELHRALQQLTLILAVNLMRDLELPDALVRAAVISSYMGQDIIPPHDTSID